MSKPQDGPVKGWLGRIFEDLPLPIVARNWNLTFSAVPKKQWSSQNRAGPSRWFRWLTTIRQNPAVKFLNWQRTQNTLLFEFKIFCTCCSFTANTCNWLSWQWILQVQPTNSKSPPDQSALLWLWALNLSLAGSATCFPEFGIARCRVQRACAARPFWELHGKSFLELLDHGDPPKVQSLPSSIKKNVLKVFGKRVVEGL